MLRLRLQGPDPRGRAEVDCFEDTLRGLVWHSWRSLGAKPGPTRVTRDHPPWNVLVIVLRNSGPHPQWKHRGTSQLWSAAPEVEKLVWGSGTEDRKLLQFQPPSCEQAKSRCPYIPGNPRSLALLSPTRKVNTSGEMHNPPQTMITFQRSWTQQSLLTYAKYVCHASPSPQRNWSSELC